MEVIGFGKRTRMGDVGGSDEFIFVVSRDEVAQIMGYPSHRSSGIPDFKIGDKLDVNVLFSKVTATAAYKKEIIDLKKVLTAIMKTLDTALTSTTVAVEAAAVKLNT